MLPYFGNMLLVLSFGLVNRALARSVKAEFLCNDVLQSQCCRLSFDIIFKGRITKQGQVFATCLGLTLGKLLIST